jgi:hypothetical protein
MSCRVSCVQQARGVFGLHNERLHMLEFGYLEQLDDHLACEGLEAISDG